jgi:UDP-GlcNAc:undecaprenyl-phosphate GlcNAc-1-phosphate transferase
MCNEFSPSVWIAAATALGVMAGAAGAAFMLARARRGRVPVDFPDERRLHTVPTPRGGGLGMLLGGGLALLLGLAAPAPVRDQRLLLVVTLVWGLPNGLIGLIDDFHPLRSRIKLAVQTTCAVLAAVLGARLDVAAFPPLASVPLGALSVPLSALWLLWTANAYNFMDGLDALAAGTALIFFAVFASWAAAAHLLSTAVFAAAMAGTMIGFLRYNRPPARIFMGDGASLFVGAVSGGVALVLARVDGAAIPISAGAIVMGTFLWDATFTIVRRLFRGDPMVPHKTHLFQRLVTAGWTHGQVRMLYLGLAAAFATGAVVMTHIPVASAVVTATALVAGVSVVAITRRVERHRSCSSRSRQNA